MEWIRKNKKYLNAIAAISAISIFYIIYHFKESNSIEKWQLGMLVIPWVIFGLCFFPLCYLSWFGNNKKGVGITIMKLFYWLSLPLYFAPFVVIYTEFVL